MRGEISVAGYFSVRMEVAEFLVVDDDADDAGDDLAVVLDADLTLRKPGQLRLELRLRPGAARMAVYQVHDVFHGGIVGEARIAKLQPVMQLCVFWKIAGGSSLMTCHLRVFSPGLARG